MPLKIVKRKGPNWYIRGTVRGIVVDESAGTDCKETAEAIRITREKELLDRSVYGKKATATWLEEAVAYMDQGGEARFMDRLNEHFGMTPLAQIRQEEADKAARALYPGASPGTLNRQVYGKISAVMKFAADRNKCDLWRVRRAKEEEEPPRWLTPDEADRLIAAASEHMRPLLIFLFYTGARMSEALYLDWRNVDLRRAHVSFPKTKNGKARGVPLHPRVVTALANLPHREAEVFRTHEGYPYARSEGGGQIKTGFKAACRRAGITDFTPHDCRHTWASWHYQANRDAIKLKELGGWKTMTMVLRYTHLNQGHNAGSINALPWGKSGEHEIQETKKEVKS